MEAVTKVDRTAQIEHFAQAAAHLRGIGVSIVAAAFNSRVAEGMRVTTVSASQVDDGRPFEKTSQRVGQTPVKAVCGLRVLRILGQPPAALVDFPLCHLMGSMTRRRSLPPEIPGTSSMYFYVSQRRSSRDIRKRRR